MSRRRFRGAVAMTLRRPPPLGRVWSAPPSLCTPVLSLCSVQIRVGPNNAEEKPASTPQKIAKLLTSVPVKNEKTIQRLPASAKTNVAQKTPKFIASVAADITPKIAKLFYSGKPINVTAIMAMLFVGVSTNGEKTTSKQHIKELQASRQKSRGYQSAQGAKNTRPIPNRLVCARANTTPKMPRFAGNACARSTENKCWRTRFSSNWDGTRPSADAGPQAVLVADFCSNSRRADANNRGVNGND